MFRIFLRKICLISGYAPINTKAFIKDGYTTIYFRVIELITLVLENCGLTQYGKAMSKSTRDKELEVIVLSKFNSDVLTVCL